MKVVGSNGDAATTGQSPEIRLKARAVSRGVAIGKIVCLYGKSRQFYRQEITEGKVAAETVRLRAAIRLARRQLQRISDTNNAKASGSVPGIFDAQALILEDPSLRANIEAEISQQLINAEWAVKLVADNYVSRYKAIPDEHLRERYIDIEDVAERILTALGGGGRTKVLFDGNSVIAARELKPSTLVEFAESSPKGLITENGGWTSHTFILAREINVPAVTGLKKLLRRVETGDDVIVDGFNGQIILHPTPQTLEKYLKAAEEFRDVTVEESEIPTSTLKTLDGREITIRANLDIPTVYKKAKRMGVHGIGLYRSEFLFNQFKGFPTENEQFDAYREIADYAGEDGVKIRTFDLGIDQLYGESTNKEKNPALGLRAVRLSLAQPKHFRAQIRALLRASFEREIDIIIPMISGIGDMRVVKDIVAKERKFLEVKGASIGEPRLGAMVEVPSAVLMIKELVKETDFICLGTNDLVQYLLAVDRDNESVSNWFRTLHPAVIRAVSSVINAASEAGKPLVICGEMAGSPFYVPLLIGLGATDLSMNVNSIRRVRQLISGIAFEEARELVDEVQKCLTAEGVELTLHSHIQSKWLHLFPSELLKSRQI